MKRYVAIIVLFGLMFGVIIGQACKVNKLERHVSGLNKEIQQLQVEQEPQVWKGQYTIFQYTRNGWTNRLYVTEYYIQDGTIYYKSRDHQNEYLPVEFEGTHTSPGWKETAEELMPYGYWEHGED